MSTFPKTFTACHIWFKSSQVGLGFDVRFPSMSNSSHVRQNPLGNLFGNCLNHDLAWANNTKTMIIIVNLAFMKVHFGAWFILELKMRRQTRKPRFQRSLEMINDRIVLKTNVLSYSPRWNAATCCNKQIKLKYFNSKHVESHHFKDFHPEGNTESHDIQCTWKSNIWRYKKTKKQNKKEKQNKNICIYNYTYLCLREAF